MTLSEELTWRGFVHQHTFANITELDARPLTFYWGVDPSGPSMTIGHLAPAMMVRQFLEHGHKAIVLVGGATGMIGDPDGKKQERDLLTLEQIDENKKNIIAQYERIFAGHDFEVVDNYDWFKDMGYLDFLREVGKKVSMSQLLDRDFIKNRIGEGGDGISYAEFSYNLIQGYDFLHLYRDKQATLQLSGADQWGNSVTGVHLIKRIEGGEANVLTTPLIVNKETGVKFGKTEAGAVWLDPTLTTPYQFYQFWLNVDDSFAEELIAKYTMLSKEAIDEAVALHAEAPYKRTLQRKLADEVTRIIHGEEKLRVVQELVAVLFEDREAGSLLEDSIAAELAAEIPTVPAQTTLLSALTDSNVADSNGSARRLIAGGGVKVNGEKVTDDQLLLTGKSLVKIGKNKFILVR